MGGLRCEGRENGEDCDDFCQFGHCKAPVRLTRCDPPAGQRLTLISHMEPPVTRDNRFAGCKIHTANA
jgi:hypothetical protein